MTRMTCTQLISAEAWTRELHGDPMEQVPGPVAELL